MIEYLYDAIRAVAGQEIAVAAVITDDDGYYITEDCSFTIHTDEGELYSTPGYYVGETSEWLFNVPAVVTKGLKGRYWYCIRHKGSNICFKQPLYLI